MNTQPFARVGAACGIAWLPVGLVMGGGNYQLRGIALAAIVLLLPFLAYLCSLLRRAEEEGGWLAQGAFATGVAGITLKLASITPEIAIHRYHVAKGTALYNALDAVAGAATDVCLFPFAVMLAAAAVVAVRTRVLPRWLGYGAGLTAVALAVNGSYSLYYYSGNVPALLLFVLWTFVASVVLLRRTWREPKHAARANPAAAA
ncbi:MAG: hypothetical protein ACXVZW_04605 [Gaiellaceae bacterium]